MRRGTLLTWLRMDVTVSRNTVSLCEEEELSDGGTLDKMVGREMSLLLLLALTVS